MDVFVEQIVKIKNSAARIIAMALIVLSTIGGALLLLMYSTNPGYNLLVLGAAALIWGAYKILLLFFIEYEYIITNGTIDIDKITAKRTRNRIVSFDCKNILRGGKYSVDAKPVTDAAETLIFCNANDSGAYYLLVNNNGKKRLIVFAPNEKMRAAIKECVPRTLAKDLFAD